MSMAVISMHLFIPAVRLHHVALKWAWEFFDRIFVANAIMVTYLLVRILNTSKVKLTALECCKGVQCEYSTNTSDTLVCCELNVT